MKTLETVKYKVKDTLSDGQLLVGFVEGMGEVMARGKFTNISPGDSLFLHGVYKQNSFIGRHFDTSFYREIVDEFWIAKWLKLDKGFKNKQIISMLLEKKELELIWHDWEQITKIYSIFKFLIKKQVPEEVISQIEHAHRWKWDELLENPYLLLTFISVSYSMVQEIIDKFQTGNPTSAKGKYLLEHILKKAHGQGHLFLPADTVAEELKKHQVKLSDVVLVDPFYREEERIYLRVHFELEKEIAANIKMRLSLTKTNAATSTVAQWQEKKGFSLAKNQVEAVEMSLLEPFSIVTGGPGVGKTTVCNCITDLLGEAFSILMVAPTGRAAKRAQESTGLMASTIHRLLEYNGFVFKRNKNHPIETDVLVIDESSMVDAVLLLAMLEATPQETKIIFVGDVDQLPSVGPGQVLRDLIESGSVPVTRLTEIFRQAADSPIISCAYAVNRGELPEVIPHPDLIYLENQREPDIFRETVAIASNLYREHSFFDVQVLIPMYKGPVGIDAINTALQQALNPSGDFIVVGAYQLRLGDKVIQTRNDYGKGINNGDVGIITQLHAKSLEVTFQGNEKPISFSSEDFGDLQLSYAITVHRSQGSEYPYTIIPVVESYGVMLQKNLLYTAITRAKKKLWLLYQATALQEAVRLESVPIRFTTLKTMLQERESA